MKNFLKKAVVLLLLAGHSFELLPMDDYAKLLYVMAPVGIVIAMHCAGGRVDRNNDLEDYEVQERVLAQVRITPEQAENLVWQVRQDQDAQKKRGYAELKERTRS